MGDDDGEDDGNFNRHHSFALLITLFTALIFFVWVAIPVVNTQFIHGYPRIASLPGPNKFVSTRGTVWSIAIGLLAINGLLPYLLITAVQEKQTSEWGALHVFVSGLAVFFSGLVFLFLFGSWLFTCNNGMGIHNTACQDPRYCCPNYAINVKALDICPNNNICTPDVAAADLTVSGPFWAHIWFAFTFTITAWVHISTNRRLVIYGVLDVT